MEQELNGGLGIGIDLGATKSCVSVFKEGKAHIIANDQDNKITPSWVAFTDAEKLIGDNAKQQAFQNHTNTVFNVKRLIGRKFNELFVQKDIKFYPFKVESGEDDKPMIIVNHKGKIKKLHPEEISALILIEMKKIAETYLSRTVKNAVITVPAYFNNSQRQATKDAGTIAGLNVIRIINESTAAAIAYGFEKRDSVEMNVLVFDLGGGSLEVSLLIIEDGFFEVKSTGSNSHLGGIDFDNLLIKYCADNFFKKNNIDITNNPKAIKRLRTQCERAKIILSSMTQATIEVDNLAESIDFILVISRTQFEELCLPYFNQCILTLQQLLDDNSMSQDQIQEIILIGGSTHIPKVKQLIEEFFNGKKPFIPTNPDDINLAVAKGAAIQGAQLTSPQSMLQNFILLDATSISLGIQTIGQKMTVLIPKNSTFPTAKSQIFTTYFDKQSGQIILQEEQKDCKDEDQSNDNVNIVDLQDLYIEVFEGEGHLTKDNHLLDKFKLNLDPNGSHQIKISFNLDETGILEVTANQEGFTNFTKKTIINQMDRFSQDLINTIY